VLIRYIPQIPFLTTDEVDIVIKQYVQSYTGTEMDKDTIIRVPIEIEPKILIATQELNLPHNTSDNISVSVLPVEAGIGKRILLRAVSPSIASVSSEVILDDLGKANIPVSGKLIGTTWVIGTLDETDLQTETTVNVTFKPLIGMDENIIQKIKIYPNPTNDEIFIKSELLIVKVEIYSITGALLFSENNFNKKISLSSLSKGVYLVKIYTDSDTMTEKIVKE